MKTFCIIAIKWKWMKLSLVRTLSGSLKSLSTIEPEIATKIDERGVMQLFNSVIKLNFWSDTIPLMTSLFNDHHLNRVEWNRIVFIYLCIHSFIHKITNRADPTNRWSTRYMQSATQTCTHTYTKIHPRIHPHKIAHNIQVKWAYNR